jgi:hypothetical protein
VLVFLSLSAAISVDVTYCVCDVMCVYVTSECCCAVAVCLIGCCLVLLLLLLTTCRAVIVCCVCLSVCLRPAAGSERVNERERERHPLALLRVETEVILKDFIVTLIYRFHYTLSPLTNNSGLNCAVFMNYPFCHEIWKSRRGRSGGEEVRN